MSINWQELLDKARWDQKDLAAALDKEPSTVSGMIKHSTGPYAGGKKTRKKALDILHARIASLESEHCPTRESEQVPVARFSETSDGVTPEQWRLKAIFYEERLKQLQSHIRSALQVSDLPPPPS